MSVRFNGLKKIIGYSIGIAITLVIAFFLFPSGFIHAWFGIPFLAVAIQAAFILIGIIEFITDIEFLELSGKWDDLEGWQRGVSMLV